MRIEVRTCVKCGETKEIPQRNSHANNICTECARNYSREYQRAEAIKNGVRIGTTGRVPYPLRDGHRTTGNLFKCMASKTFKCKTKEEWRGLMKERLDNVFQNDELCRWIFAHNDGDEPKDKKPNKIKEDYPDTRYMTWEDFENNLDEEDIDS